MIRWVLGIFLILHGVTHAFFPSYGTYDSWLIGNAQGLAIPLMWLATGLFVVVGLGAILRTHWWRSVALVAAIESLVFLGLFWQSGQIFGVLIDVAIIAGVLYWR
jgi:hypothetical protein